MGARRTTAWGALAAGAIAAASVVSGAAAAHAAPATVAIDCATLPADEVQFILLPGETMTLTTTGFTYFQDVYWDDYALHPAGDSVLVGDEPGWLYFTDDDDTCELWVEVTVAGSETVPAGGLLFTRDIEIPANPSELVVAPNSSDPDDEGDHLFGGLDGCDVWAGGDGRHVYGTLDITVLLNGTYTFRGMSTDPLQAYVGYYAWDPIGDPFLALYSDFDPANPDDGVIGCNDDLNDVGAENDAEVLDDGTIIEGHLPYFVADLTPGEYTLVLMTYDELGVDEFTAGMQHTYADEDEPGYPETDTYRSFAIGAKSVSFQVWGPDGGLQIGHAEAAAPTLAATGATPLAGLIMAFGLAFAGAVLVASRMRARRTA